MNRVVSILLFVSLTLLAAGQALAQVVSPVQSGHYTPANINIRDMAHPPPGLSVLWYNAFVNTDKYVDRNGDEFRGVRLSDINPALPNIGLDLDLNAYATLPALYWASPFKFLGGARYMGGIVPSYVNADATVVTEIGGGIIDTTFTDTVRDEASGFGDLFVAPLGLSWELEKVDITAFYGFYAPTGRYTTGAANNVGLGFWTHQLQAFGYYYPQPDKATAIMVGLTLELNGDIEDSDVRPGSRLSLEWGVSQYLSDRFDVGIQGGHNWQISDDSGGDVFWDPSVHDRKSTVAFSAGYWPVPDWLYVTGKYAFDFGVRQRFKNNTFSINVIVLTHFLAGGERG